MVNFLNKDYVMVEGYKATNKDMTCRGFQYKLGETHIIEGDPEICNNGFHFCLNLKDTFQYYHVSVSRFFKVKAMVKREDILKFNADKDDKLVAKGIEFIEEVSFEEMRPHLHLPECITDQVEYDKYNKLGEHDYFRNKFLIETNGEFEDDVKGLFFDDYFKIYSDERTQEEYSKLVDRVKIINKQNVSLDTKLMLLFNIV